MQYNSRPDLQAIIIIIIIVVGDIDGGVEVCGDTYRNRYASTVIT